MCGEIAVQRAKMPAHANLIRSAFVRFWGKKMLESLRACMVEVEAYYRQRGIFQGKFGFGAKPALIVIDMACGWTDPAYAGGSSRLDSAIAAINQLAPRARSKKVPVIFTTSPYPDRPRLKTAADPSPGFRPWDARACQIDERLALQPGDDLI